MLSNQWYFPGISANLAELYLFARIWRSVGKIGKKVFFSTLGRNSTWKPLLRPSSPELSTTIFAHREHQYIFGFQIDVLKLIILFFYQNMLYFFLSDPSLIIVLSCKSLNALVETWLMWLWRVKMLSSHNLSLLMLNLIVVVVKVVTWICWNWNMDFS